MSRARDLADSADLNFDDGTLVIDSGNNRVGIGTASPAFKTDLKMSSGTREGGFVIRRSTNDSHQLGLWTTAGQMFIDAVTNDPTAAGRIVFRRSLDTGSTFSESMRIDESGNVGIGTSSPVDFLHPRLVIGEGSADEAMTIYTGSSNAGSIFFADGNAANARFAGQLRYYHDTNAMTMVTANIERLKIDSSGNVGIGTTSPEGILHTNGSGDRTVKFQAAGESKLELKIDGTSDGCSIRFSDGDASSRGQIRYQHSTDSLGFYTAASERMRIDSSGNLLVGKTTDAFGTAGTLIGSDGLQVTRSAGSPVFINRLSSDGTLTAFYKDGSLVGSIGVGINQLLIGQSGTNVILDNSNERFAPSDAAGSSNDGNMTLGWSNRRWKDLYLSGGVYLGGTGSANYLDDYEEGTWTPSFYASTGSISYTSYTAQTGSYTKIGRMVHCRFRVRATKSGSGNTGISGLPFTADSDFQSGGCFGGAREQSALGTFFQTEGVTTSGQISVLREYDNGGLPDGVIDVAGYVIYYIP